MTTHTDGDAVVHTEEHRGHVLEGVHGFGVWRRGVVERVGRSKITVATGRRRHPERPPTASASTSTSPSKTSPAHRRRRSRPHGAG